MGYRNTVHEGGEPLRRLQRVQEERGGPAAPWLAERASASGTRGTGVHGRGSGLVPRPGHAVSNATAYTTIGSARFTWTGFIHGGPRGDHRTRSARASGAIPQVRGIGGSGSLGSSGAATRTLPGGLPGSWSPFVDRSQDNDFFGTGVDLFRRRIVTGELTQLIVGGGGGDLAIGGAGNWINDPRGGGGYLVLIGDGFLTVVGGWRDLDGPRDARACPGSRRLT